MLSRVSSPLRFWNPQVSTTMWADPLNKSLLINIFTPYWFRFSEEPNQCIILLPFLRVSRPKEKNKNTQRKGENDNESILRPSCRLYLPEAQDYLIPTEEAIPHRKWEALDGAESNPCCTLYWLCDIRKWPNLSGWVSLPVKGSAS